MKYFRKIYASKQHEKDTGYACILKPELPQPVMKHSVASPSSVADVMTKKYANGMPLTDIQNQLALCSMDFQSIIHES